MDQAQLNEIIRKHQLWLWGEDGGERANLRYANLGYANLRGADLRGADLRDASLRGADLRGADLRDASLRGADLEGASLEGANLDGANGNLREIKSVFLETWPITYTSEHLQIGCQRHPIADWWRFSDEKIAAMDSEALDWWHKWKDTLRTLIEMSPAVPTGKDEKK